MISALILIMNYLYDYGKVDLSNVEKMQELNYIGDVKNSLMQTLQISCANSQNPEMNLVLSEKNLKERLLERGIVLEVAHTNVGCNPEPVGDITFKIKSNTFSIENSFSV